MSNAIAIEIERPQTSVQLLRQGASGFWVILGLHVPTGRKFAWFSNANEFDAAMEDADKQAKELDPFGGEWKFASNWTAFDALIEEYNSDFLDTDSPIPFNLTERMMDNSFQFAQLSEEVVS